MNKKNTSPTSIRLDEELLQRIKNDAENNKRSITNQIEYMLCKYYEMKENFNN